MQFITRLLFFAGSWLASGAQWHPRAQQQLQQKLDVGERPALTWRYPEPPAEEERNLDPNFTLRQPAAPQSVRVECGEQVVRVEAQKDLMGIGQLILGSDILLGDCPPSEEPLEAPVLVFQYPLHSCGSQLRASIFTGWFSLGGGAGARPGSGPGGEFDLGGGLGCWS